jgi:hypothetical protein
MLPCLRKHSSDRCLGCGFQRDLLLLQGDFRIAFKMYPAILPRCYFWGILGFNWIDKTEL